MDTGVGMTDAQLARVSRFDAFVQADSSTSRQFGGTGLGLRISHALATMLGGGLRASSEEGRGSTFTVHVATGPLEGAEWVNALSDEDAGEEAGPMGSQNGDDRLPLEGVKVLLAEDGPDNQRLIAYLLTRAGAQVAVRENGQDVLVALTSGEPLPDLVLMDMHMPVMDGYEATRRLRDAGIELPVLALTAQAMVSDRQRCLDVGCNAYMTKPIDATTLVNAVETWSGRAQGMASRDVGGI